jgi:hypothetical protein
MKVKLTIVALLIALFAQAQSVPTFFGYYKENTAYTVLREWRLNFGNEYLGEIVTTWDNLRMGQGEAASSPFAASYQNLLTTTGANSTLSVTRTNAWLGGYGGAPVSADGYPHSTAILADAIVEMAWVFGSTGTLRISGLSPNRFYQVHLLANHDTYRNTVATYQINGDSQTKNIAGNYGVSGDDPYTSSTLLHFQNVQTNAQGYFDLVCTWVSGSFGVEATVNALIIEETNIAKP